MIDISKEIKRLLFESGNTQVTLADKLGTKQSNIAAKLKRNDLRIKEIESIADVLGYKVHLVFEKKEVD